MSFKVGEVLDPDVNPFYQIIGRQGETGKIRLREGYSRSHVFTKGNTYKMSVKSPDIGEVCIGKYVNLSELFVRGLSLLLMKRFCMKTSRSMIFINKKIKPGRVNAEFNFTSRIFLCVDIIFLRQKQCFFKGDKFSEG